MAGKSGSLIIDIAADIAELKKNFADAEKSVTDFAEKIGTIGKQLTGALAGLEIAKSILDFAKDVAATGVAAQELSQKLKLTAEQAQALQIISQRTGQSMDELAKYGKANVDWLQQVTEEAKRAGLVIDNEFTASLKRSSDESAEAERRLKVLFAPAVAGVKSWVADAIERIADDLKTVASAEGVLDKIITLGRMLGYGGGPGAAQAFRIDTLQANVDKAEAALRAAEHPRTDIGMQPDPATTAAAQKARDDALTQLGQERDRAARAGYGDPFNNPLAITTTATRITGGGGGTDRFGQSLEQLKSEQQAVDDGIRKLTESTGLATKEAERLAKLQVDIGTGTAKAIRRAGVTDPGEKKQIEDGVRALEESRYKFETLKETIKTADDVNTKFGDGTKTLTDRLFYLDKALGDNRITQEEYAVAVRDATAAQQEQADKAKSYQGGVEAFVAGIRSAARQASSIGTEFKLGQDLFTKSMDIMSAAISDFVKTGKLDFGKLAESFAAMLADMAVKWAAAEFIREAFGTSSTVTVSPFAAGGGPQGPSGGAVAADAGWISQLFSWAGSLFSGGMNAAGGDVQPGRYYTVGEAGPERFVPTMPGTIVPNGAGAQGAVTVNVDMGTTAGTGDPASALAFGRKIKAAVVDVISNEKRPGGTLYARMSA